MQSITSASAAKFEAALVDLKGVNVYLFQTGSAIENRKVRRVLPREMRRSLEGEDSFSTVTSVHPTTSILILNARESSRAQVTASVKDSRFVDAVKDPSLSAPHWRRVPFHACASSLIANLTVPRR
jgi:hypothetical protein